MILWILRIGSAFRVARTLKGMKNGTVPRDLKTALPVLLGVVGASSGAGKLGRVGRLAALMRLVRPGRH